MDLLCEKNCDMTACKKGKVTFTHEEYFQKIMDMLLMDGRRERYRLFAIADGTSSYERRVKYMADYHKHGGMKKSTAFVVAALFCSVVAPQRWRRAMGLQTHIRNWRSIRMSGQRKA